MRDEVHTLIDDARCNGTRDESKYGSGLVHDDPYWAYNTIVDQSFYLASYQDLVFKIIRIAREGGDETSDRIINVIAEEKKKSMAERRAY